MRKLLLLFAALLVAGCGEKLSPEGSDSPGASAEPSADAAKLSDDGLTLPLSDTDVERLLKEAVDSESLEDRDGVAYHDSKPYIRLAKVMADSGQVAGFAQFKDGEEAQTYPESKKQPHPVPISLREVGGSVSNQSFCHACK